MHVRDPPELSRDMFESKDAAHVHVQSKVSKAKANCSKWKLRARIRMMMMNRITLHIIWTVHPYLSALSLVYHDKNHQYDIQTSIIVKNIINNNNKFIIIYTKYPFAKLFLFGLNLRCWKCKYYNNCSDLCLNFLNII